MAESYKITLPNSVEVQYYLGELELEKFSQIAESSDFLQETDVMKRICNYPPMSLLVYDDVMALGLYSTDGSIDGQVSVCLRPYSDSLLITWVDQALSLRKHPIRTVEKTTTIGEMFRRLKPRTDLDWIEYDSETQVIREIHGKPCSAQKYLESMPANKELYTLFKCDNGKIEVTRMTINDRWEGNGIRTEGEMLDHLYDEPIEEVEKMLKKKYPNALMIREPLSYCTFEDTCKPWSCLAHIFEKTYADKIGFEYAEPHVLADYKVFDKSSKN